MCSAPRPSEQGSYRDAGPDPNPVKGGGKGGRNGQGEGREMEQSHGLDPSLVEGKWGEGRKA